ncbi:GNAT family N-acetyltransferase [Psychrobacillus sp. INOP01]|uniref:GNAT family N-acetyltransferase n=1 Tax=Psychrobacillus sp. INOP01 TaxID=2829187 RepID=UPI001BA87FB0|nr:GNAT family N-acetyltransferase [Psychrobacillus sp. INOP01]QUG39986.1 GNAT family N-acetyltransferase [Psychrobacillus sp. INOP01]
MKEWKGKLGEKEYVVHELTLEHLDSILRLQHIVLRSMEDENFLSPLTIEEFEDSIAHNLMIGAFVDNELIAFRALALPPIDDHHLGYDIGLSPEQLEKVVYQEITNVHPDYRGFGLQKKLGVIVMELLDASPYTHVCATVAPFNIASLKDKLSQGMVIGALKKKYGGMLRYVFYKKIHVDRISEDKLLEIPMDAIEKQQQLIADGWIATAILQKENNWYVVFEEKGTYI